jgi:hypothetical protein
VLDRTGLDREQTLRLVPGVDDKWQCLADEYMTKLRERADSLQNGHRVIQGELAEPEPEPVAPDDDADDDLDEDEYRDSARLHGGGDGSARGPTSSFGPWDVKTEEQRTGEFSGPDLNRPDTEPIVRSRRPRRPPPGDGSTRRRR